MSTIVLNYDQALNNFKEKYESNQFETENQAKLVEIDELITNLKEYKKASHELKELFLKQDSSTCLKCFHMSARLLELWSDEEKSTLKLKQSIEIYKKLINNLGQVKLKINKIDQNLLFISGFRLVDRLKFLGNINDTLKYLIIMLDYFPDNLCLMNELGICYMLLNRFSLAKEQFERVFFYDSSNVIALCHYGFILKQNEGKINESIDLFRQCLSSGEESVMDGRFFYHLGDALQRTNRTNEVRNIFL